MIISRSIHIAANGIMSFFFTAKQYSILHINYTFFIHLSTGGHLGCLHIFHILGIEIMLLQTLWNVYLFKLVFLFLSDVYLGVELLGHMLVLFLFFCKTSALFFIGTDCTKLHFHRQFMRVSYFPHLHQHLLFVVFLMIAILTGMRCSLCGFDLYFSDNQ